jgi:hypothetical protein
MVGLPPSGRKAALSVAQRASWMETDLRGRICRLGLYAEAQTDVDTVAYDGNATQHQGLQSEDGHDGPPAIVEESGADLNGSAGDALSMILSLSTFANGRFNKADEETVSAPMVLTSVREKGSREKRNFFPFSATVGSSVFPTRRIANLCYLSYS